LFSTEKKIKVKKMKVQYRQNLFGNKSVLRFCFVNPYSYRCKCKSWDGACLQRL